MYFDNILIFSKSEEEHVQHLKQELQVLRKNPFYAKMAKCYFGKEESHYLGHVVSKEGINPRKIKIVTK